jgi:replication factor C subunit 2/4
MKVTNIPWVDKYRPSKLSQIIQQNEIIRVLQNMVKVKNVPHLLFYGPPGTGKTSTIYALALELFGVKMDERILELNASDERGISVVRNKITKFAKSSVGGSAELYPPIKIIIMDEADAMTHEAQSALRKLMEITPNTRFCFICNYKSQIIEPIESRCACFRFRSIGKKVLRDKINMIAVKEKLNLGNNVAKLISKLSEGDARRAIMILHNLKYIYDNIELTVDDVKKVTGYFDKLNFKITDLSKCSINQIEELVSNLINDGHPLNYILEHIKDLVLESKIKEEKKATILLYLANIEVLLIKKGNEYIQLLALITYIKMVIST